MAMNTVPAAVRPANPVHALPNLLNGLVAAVPRFPAPAGSLAASAQATDPSRRTLVGGAGLAALLITGGAAAHVQMPAGVSKVETAWADLWVARNEMQNADHALSMALEDPNHSIHQRIRTAENVIRDTPETGARVAEIRLWLSIVDEVYNLADAAAVEREDVEWLIAHAEEPEFHTVMALHAIRALRGEG